MTELQARPMGGTCANPGICSAAPCGTLTSRDFAKEYFVIQLLFTRLRK